MYCIQIHLAKKNGIHPIDDELLLTEMQLYYLFCEIASCCVQVNPCSFHIISGKFRFGIFISHCWCHLHPAVSGNTTLPHSSLQHCCCIFVSYIYCSSYPIIIVTPHPSSMFLLPLPMLSSAWFRPCLTVCGICHIKTLLLPSLQHCCWCPLAIRDIVFP